jgi:hypothetical protein
LRGQTLIPDHLECLSIVRLTAALEKRKIFHVLTVLTVKFKSFRRIVQRFDDLFTELIQVIRMIGRSLERPGVRIKGGELTLDLTKHLSLKTELQLEKEGSMPTTRTITLPADKEDFGYTIGAITEAFDSEGNDILSLVQEHFGSSDPDVVSVMPDEGGIHSGKIHIGKPGTALLNHSVSVQVGRETVTHLVDVTTFIVTSGLPATFVGGAPTFDGVEADPTEPPPPPPEEEEPGQ